MNTEKQILRIPIKSIRLDGDTQSRDSVNQVIVNEYADDMREGAVFPPVIVFDDGNDMWLSEGFHRLYAARQTGQTEIEADVRKGTKRDAQRNSMQSNATHGARRTNADKRRAVAMAFRWLMEEGRSLEGITDTEVAGMAAVTRFVVSMMRKEIVSEVDTNRSKCNEPRINGVAPSVEIKRLQSELETSKRETHSVEQQLSAVQSDLRLVKRALEATPEVVERDKEFLRNKLKEEQERHEAGLLPRVTLQKWRVGKRGTHVVSTLASSGCRQGGVFSKRIPF